MNAAAAAQLEELIRGRNPVQVKSVSIRVIGEMVPSVLRQKFAAARAVEFYEDGMGAQQEDGSWLWVDSNRGGGR
jgi:hypothetical protein